MHQSARIQVIFLLSCYYSYFAGDYLTTYLYFSAGKSHIKENVFPSHQTMPVFLSVYIIYFLYHFWILLALIFIRTLDLFLCVHSHHV